MQLSESRSAATRRGGASGDVSLGHDATRLIGDDLGFAVAVAGGSDAHRAPSALGVLRQYLQGQHRAPSSDRPWLEVLGVPPHANREAIDRAYRQLVRTHHPGVGGDKVQFQEIQAAYEEAIAS